MENNIRLGKISAVDYAAGTVRVVYHEKDDAVTAPIPLISSEYFHAGGGRHGYGASPLQRHGGGRGPGTTVERKEQAPGGSKGLYRKDLARSPGEAMIRYKDGTMTIKVAKLVIDGTVTVSGRRDRRRGFPGQPHPHGQHGRRNLRAIVRRRFTHDRERWAQNHF